MPTAPPRLLSAVNYAVVSASQDWPAGLVRQACSVRAPYAIVTTSAVATTAMEAMLAIFIGANAQNPA